MVEAVVAWAGLEFRNVSVMRTGQREPLLEGLSLRASKGSVTVICGPNGSGKSSLFQALARAHRGVSLVGSVDLLDPTQSTRQLRVADLGYLPQDQDFVPTDSVRTFIEFASLSLGTDRLMQRSLEHFSVEALLPRSLRSLSGGQWKRVQCAAHFGARNAVRLLDEPEGGLDGRGLNTLITAIEEAKAAGEIILVASHSRSFVRDVADDVVYLDGGRVSWQTSKDEFVEKGPINELSY